ncbi:MAG: DUF2927 domain-containing protein [Methanomicrobiales archaeon]|jgi:hypothetical protein
MNTGTKSLILAFFCCYLVIGSVTAARVQLLNASGAPNLPLPNSDTGTSLRPDIPSPSGGIAPPSKTEITGEFMTLALDLKDPGSSHTVNKWARPSVAVGVTGGPDEPSKECLAEAITEINNLTSSVSLYTNDREKPAIEMNFIPLKEFPRQIKGYVANSEGYTRCESTKGLLQKCTIWVPTTDVTDDLRCTIIRHELTHGIGLFGHSTHPESIMYQGTTATGYSLLDQEVIRLLYNTRIFPGSTEETVREYLSE